MVPDTIRNASSCGANSAGCIRPRSPARPKSTAAGSPAGPFVRLHPRRPRLRPATRHRPGVPAPPPLARRPPTHSALAESPAGAERRFRRIAVRGILIDSPVMIFALDLAQLSAPPGWSGGRLSRFGEVHRELYPEQIAWAQTLTAPGLPPRPHPRNRVARTPRRDHPSRCPRRSRAQWRVANRLWTFSDRLRRAAALARQFDLPGQTARTGDELNLLRLIEEPADVTAAAWSARSAVSAERPAARPATAAPDPPGGGATRPPRRRRGRPPAPFEWDQHECRPASRHTPSTHPGGISSPRARCPTTSTATGHGTSPLNSRPTRSAIEVQNLPPGSSR